MAAMLPVNCIAQYNFEHYVRDRVIRNLARDLSSGSASQKKDPHPEPTTPATTIIPL